jgi:cytochrome c
LGIIVLALAFACNNQPKEKSILVFSKTAGFRHGSIEKGVEVLKKLGVEKGYKVIHTENVRYFVEDSLKQYGAVVFLNTTGDFLNDAQQSEFERYIQAGGGYVGIHAATDAEYNWPWYNKLAGAYFAGHPSVQKATLNVLDKTHASTSFMDDTEEMKDEWYNFKNINPEITVLLNLEEDTYQGGENGEDHPIAWYRKLDGGGISIYTAGGHTDEAYDELEFREHILQSILFALGE